MKGLSQKKKKALEKESYDRVLNLMARFADCIQDHYKAGGAVCEVLTAASTIQRYTQDHLKREGSIPNI